MSTKLLIGNMTKGCDLVTDGKAADRVWSRVRGLIGVKSLGEGQGLWITPCNGIHTFFMRIPLDVLYLNAELQVVALDEAMPPWRFGRFHRGAKSVVELPSGTIATTGTEVGDQLSLERH